MLDCACDRCISSYEFLNSQLHLYGIEILIWYYRKNNPGEVVIQSENGERRVLRSTPDWTEEAVNGDHLWVATSASGDLCYVLDQECTVISFPPRLTTRLHPAVTILLYNSFHVAYRRPLHLPISSHLSNRSAGRKKKKCRHIFLYFPTATMEHVFAKKVVSKS